jgi:signal transduction histidine kinase
MGETKSSTGGFHRITRLVPQVRVRVFGFVLVVVCGSALLGWITRTTWLQLEQLQKEHAAVKSESFYMGVTLRSGIRSLNGKLLEYSREKDPEITEAFSKEAEELKHWVQANRLRVAAADNPRLIRTLGLSDDLQLLRTVDEEFQTYLARTERILKPGPAIPELDTFEEVYREVQVASGELLALCDRLVVTQGKGFGEFLSETQRTLGNHQRLLQMTSALILAMAGMLTLLVYRGMIAPLRRGLTQSKKIIERQEKLAALGVLASGVAHEIRNPLTAIKFRLFSLEKTVPALADNEDAGIISNEINRLERIVKDFLRFARPSEPEMSPIPAERIVTEVRQFLAGQLEREGILLQIKADSSVWIDADPQQMKQVLINLLRNAVEAIEGAGTVTIGVREDTAELEGTEKPVAVISVTDTGKGIDPSVEERLFDPFFTTKDRGTGLGLAIAARIVEKHGGILRYETKLNRGTTFEVVLPKVENEGANTTTN